MCEPVIPVDPSTSVEVMLYGGNGSKSRIRVQLECKDQWRDLEGFWSVMEAQDKLIVASMSRTLGGNI